MASAVFPDLRALPLKNVLERFSANSNCKIQYVALLVLSRGVSVTEWLVCLTHIHVGQVRTPSAIFLLQTRTMLKKSMKIYENRQKNLEKS